MGEFRLILPFFCVFEGALFPAKTWGPLSFWEKIAKSPKTDGPWRCRGFGSLKCESETAWNLLVFRGWDFFFRFQSVSNFWCEFSDSGVMDFFHNDEFTPFFSPSFVHPRNLELQNKKSSFLDLLWLYCNWDAGTNCWVVGNGSIFEWQHHHHWKRLSKTTRKAKRSRSLWSQRVVCPECGLPESGAPFSEIPYESRGRNRGVYIYVYMNIMYMISSVWCLYFLLL